MKYIVSLAILVLSYGLSNAQQPQVVGSSHGSGTVGSGTAAKTIQYSIGQIGVTQCIAVGSTYKMQCGFPYGILYLNYCFTTPLRVSKGYYADFVQLDWDVNAKNADYVKRFYVYRRKAGASDSSQVAILDASVRTWQDLTAESNMLYDYILYADGISADFKMDKLNTTRGSGFRLPTGRITGRITYEGGTAVEGVTVMAETSDALVAKSLYLNGTSSIYYSPVTGDKSFNFETGFGFQAWFRPAKGAKSQCLFEKGGQYKVSYDSTAKKVFFYVGNTELSVPVTIEPNTFYHITATLTANSKLARLIVLAVTADKTDVYSTSSIIASLPTANTNDLRIGSTSANTEYFNGYVKDIRLWNKGLDSAWIVKNANRFLSGDEDGLLGYYNQCEGAGTTSYDGSKIGATYNEHHLSLVNVAWSDVLPSKTQLAVKGRTDANGNYSIVGIPYATNGSTYRFTPMLGQHTFEAKEALLFMGKGSNIHDGIDFVDKSAFKVTGNIRYNETKFPVEGVTIKVDEKAAVTKSGAIIQSDAMGNFSVDVPIGLHSVSVEMYGHTFATASYSSDFQQAVSGLEFVDNTLIKITGRVVGGPEQAAMKALFGKSKNNIGSACITLTTQKEKDLIAKNENVQRNWDHEQYVEGTLITVNRGKTKDSVLALNPKEIKIYPDTKTGEYVCYLLPEKYVVSSVIAGKYTFAGVKQVVDLTKAYAWITNTDTVLKSEAISNNGKDTIRTYRVDSLKTQRIQDFVYRVINPTITVTSIEGSPVFGETKLSVIEDKTKVWISLLDSTGKLRVPNQVFTQRENYRFKIAVSETYTNPELGADSVNIVPVTDGKIEITNDLAIDNTRHQLTLDAKGTVIESFSAGLPSLTGEYARTLSITSLTGKNNSIITEWKPNGQVFKGLVLGGMPLGTNFTTKGPTKIDVILRDPPGSGSYAYLEKGSSTVHTETRNFVQENNTSIETKFMLGGKVKTFAGVGAGCITEVEIENNVTAGVSYEHHYESGNTTSTTVTTTETFKTSSSNLYDGTQGDLFVGHSENIVYGKALFVDLLTLTECALNGSCIGDTIESKSGKQYRFGQKDGLRFSPEIKTTFMYTTDDIENKIIPDLQMIRNAFFAKQPEIYVSKLAPNDASFAKDTSTYSVVVPSYWPQDSLFVDSVAIYNQEIKGWHKTLADNEKAKINSSFIENISFGGGTEYEKSIENATSSTDETNFEFKISPKIGGEFGGAFNGFGLQITLNEELGFGGNNTTSDEESSSTKFGYVLTDGSQGDFISVDIRKPGDAFGPVFKTQGGQTSCPYEAGVTSKYYNPGTVLNNATEQMEIPLLRVEQAMVSNIPEDQAALFTLHLSNENKAFSSWFMLRINDVSNPNGALIKMDGSAIGSGRLIYIPAGQEVTKVLSVEKVRPDVYNYEDLGLILHSTCQYDPTDNQEDIFSLVNVTARFQPICSKVAFGSQTNQWVTNTITGDQMPIDITGYNLAHNSLTKILFQYKSSSSSQWTTDKSFYKDSADYKAASAPKAMIGNSASISYTWDMHSLIDRNYDIRLRTECADGSVYETDKLSGVKDVKRPQLFGTPQPSDGVLSAGEDVAVQFDETIEAGLLTPYNFTVQAVVNGTAIANNTSLYFDGTSASVSVPAAASLNGKSFTIELWANPSNITNASTMVFYGESDANSFQLNAVNGKLQIKNMGQVIEVPLSLTQSRWQHIGVAYDADIKTFDVYLDDKIANGLVAKTAFAGSGKLLFGKHINNSQYFTGRMHEVRLWNKVRTQGEVYSNMNLTLSGSEVGLCGYWPMDEADGVLCSDKARSRTATLSGASWSVEPRGKSRSFDGSSNRLVINTASSVIITDEMDYTLEFWFKTAGTDKEMCLFSSGKADGSDIVPSRALNISIAADGSLLVKSNKNATISINDKKYTDNVWHHFAYILNRNSAVKVLIDGATKASQAASAFGSLAAVEMWLGARGYIHNPQVYAQFDTALAAQNTAFTTYYKAQHAFDSCQKIVASKYAAFTNKTTQYDSIARLFVIADSVLRVSDSVWTFARNNYFAQIATDTILYDSAKVAQLQIDVNRLTSLIAALSHVDKTKEHILDTTFTWLQNKYNAAIAAHSAIQTSYKEVLAKYKVATSGASGMYAFDNYFKGQIDELRIWNVARSSKQIAIDKNAKLSGNEKGLLAYYPFEHYVSEMGVQKIDTTLNDQYIPRYVTQKNGGRATAISGSYSDDAPNLKDARPVQKLAFNWVTNNDKIIITIDEDASLIEKCIVEFTVEGIEDKNQNRLASPISWTAFISRNQVKWDESTVSLAKELYAAMSFDATFTNNGGTIRSFELKGLPSWLTASPASGSINPQSSQTVHFTINEALNSGSYDETIYLSADAGMPEPLALSLLVSKAAPVWTVNSSVFENSMNIIAQVSIDGILSVNPNDKIGVFVNGECRGVAQLQYVATADLYEAFIDVYSNKTSGETLEFRVWNANRSVVHGNVLPTDLTFVANTIVGTLLKPLLITATNSYMQHITLDKGWNWISFNVASPLLNSPSQLMSKTHAVSGDLLKSKNYFGQVYRTASNFSLVGDIANKTLSNTEMYMLKSSAIDSLIIFGTELNTQATPIAIAEGWNWIGFTPSENITLNEALAQMTPQANDVIKSQRQFAMYEPSMGWVGSLQYMTPGRGYMYLSKNTKAFTFAYPQTSKMKSDVELENQASEINASAFEHQMTVIAKVENQALSANSLLYSTSNGSNCGRANYDSRTGLFFITVYSNSAQDTAAFSLLDSKTGKSFSFNEKLAFEANAVTGTVAAPFILKSASETTELGSQSPSSRLACSPTVFNNKLDIEFEIDTDGACSLELFDIAGIKLADLLITSNATQGMHHLTVDTLAAKLAAGVYVVRLIHHQTICNQRIIKQ